MVTEFSGTGTGGATRLSLGLDVGEHLDRGADELLYTYTASNNGEVGPLHAYTLTDFDGQRWGRGEEPDELEPVGSRSLWPAPIPGDTSDLEVDITIENLGQDRLLLPEEPRQLSIEGDWAYDPDRDEVIGSGSTPLDYQVQIHQRQVGAADLESTQPGDVGDQHLRVPETGYQDQIAALTQEVVEEAGASTPYEQVVAVQDYLRHDPQFSYSVSVEPAQTTDAVWDFLGNGEGYCVQFATAMVMMVRTLDIPARLAVGFLPGDARQDGVVEVSGHRAHAWPQVHFAGAGWVRFEPTPAVRTGQSPEWTRQEAQDDVDPEPESTQEPSPSVTEPEELQAPHEEAAPEAEDEDPGSGEPLALGLALVILVIGVVLAAHWSRRRGATDEVEAHWRRVERLVAARAGVPWGEAATVRQVAEAAGLTGPAADSMRQLADAVEVHRYGPPGRRAPETEQVRQWSEEVLAGVREHKNQEGT